MINRPVLGYWGESTLHRVTQATSGTPQNHAFHTIPEEEASINEAEAEAEAEGHWPEFPPPGPPIRSPWHSQAANDPCI